MSQALNALAEPEAVTLPRLLYVGDVPIEESVGGAVLLYRLLQNYPAGKLRIIEGNLWPSKPRLRLPFVAYDGFHVGVERLLRSRVTPLYAAYLQAKSSRQAFRLDQVAKDFRAEGILTVAHGFSWGTAAALADRLGLPLHLIVHDDWPSFAPVPAALKNWLHRRFAGIYRQAATRFCISPYMLEEYQSRYGVRGTLLYPLRSPDVLELPPVPTKTNERERGPVFVYLGSVHGGGYEEPLKLLASVLEEFGGQLIIYGKLSQADLASLGLQRKNVECRPHAPVKELYSILRREADMLVVSMSFAESFRHNMGLNFPTKITDYTAIGLPILICGPAYSSAVRWARENPGVAEVVDQCDASLLRAAVKGLVDDPEHRSSLARQANAVGAKYFSHHEVTQQFYRALDAGQACASSL
jgi:glycosyltransferase involved in cell wall biosynthesis